MGTGLRLHAVVKVDGDVNEGLLNEIGNTFNCKVKDLGNNEVEIVHMKTLAANLT